MNTLANINNLSLAHINKAKIYFTDSLSKNTKQSYEKDQAHFLEFGGSFPASEEMITAYLNMCGGIYKYSTIKRRLKAISKWHTTNFIEDNPANTIMIKHIMKGIKNTHGDKEERALPFTIKDIGQIYDTLKDSTKFIDIRNLAIIMLGFHGWYRREEIVNLQFEDIEFKDEGISVTIRKSKTDQGGTGRTNNICKGNPASKYCPVEILKRWLKVGGIEEGYLFRNIARSNTIKNKKLNGYTISCIVKEVAKKANIPNYEQYSGHSLRRGGATEALINGANPIFVRDHGGWKNFNTMLNYFHGVAFKDNPTSYLLN